MAKVFLESGEAYLVGNNKTDLYGVGGTGLEVVNVAAGVSGVTVDQNVDRMVFNADTSALSFKQSGINLEVYSGTTLLATIPLQADADGTLITTATGTMQAKVSATGMTLGGAPVSATAAGMVSPTTVDTSVKAPSSGGGSTPTPPASGLPELTVANVSATEGNSGTKNLTFVLSLSSAPSSAVVVNFETVSESGTGIATSNDDYQPAAGVVSFAAGQTAATVSVVVNGDTTFEPNETFKVKFSSSGIKAGVTATGTITNDDSDTSNVAQTFTLTTSSDAFTGGSGNDSFNAANASQNAAGQTFTAADVLNGGAGTDTLRVDVGGALTYAMTNVSNIENVEANFSAAGTLSLLGSSGVSSLTSSGSTNAAIFSNIGSTAVKLGVSNSALGATFGFTAAAVAGTADTATITLSNQTAGTNVIAGVETLNIVSSGSANAVTAFTTTSTTKYVISGDQTLNLGTLDTAVLTVDASAATAGVTFTSDQATASTITGGAGNDSFTMTGTNAVNDNIIGGAGNDTVTFSANLATTDSVNGGDGTDTLQLTTALATLYTAPSTPTISNFETLKLSNALAGSLTLASVQAGLSTLDLNAGSGAQSVVLEAGSKTIKIGAANTGTLTVSDTGTATTDSLTVSNTGSGISLFGTGNGLTVTGFETVTINGSGTGTATTQAAGAISVTPDTGGTATLNFVGSNTFTTAGAITAAVVDASGLTGAAKLTMSTAAASGLTSMVGSVNADTLIGDASSSIDGGAGNDTITGGTGADTIIGGLGSDNITGGGGNDVITGGDGGDSIDVSAAAGAVSVDGGPGNDTITLGGTLTSTDTLVGGDGTDTLVLTDADVTAANALAISAVNTFNGNLSGIEVLSLSGLAQSIDLGRIKNISTLSLNATAGTATISGLAATNSVTLTAAPTAALTFSLADATGSADTVALTLNAATSIAAVGNAINVGSIESVTIAANDSDTTSSGATADAAHTMLLTDTTTTDVLANVTVTGNALSLGLTLTGSTAVSKLDGSAFAGALTAALASTVAATVTGGAGADVLTGGTKADSISGGAGSDTLAGGLGADTLDGGTGTNTLDASGMVSVTDSDGNVTSTGAVVNLSASAISGATINTNLSGSFISGALSSIASGTAGYLFGSSSNLASVTVDTVSNFTKVTGTSGPDYLAGGAAAESLSGAAGADYITGGAGNDTITGGADVDVIDGGTGADTIVLYSTAANNDTITFVAADDVLAFAAITGDMVVGTALTIQTVAGKTSAANRVIVDTIANLGASGVTIGDQSAFANDIHYAIASDTGAIFYDADGNWTAGVIAVGTITAAQAALLTAANFTVV